MFAWVWALTAWRSSPFFVSPLPRTSTWCFIRVVTSCFADGVPRWSLTALCVVWSLPMWSARTRRGRIVLTWHGIVEKSAESTNSSSLHYLALLYRLANSLLKLVGQAWSASHSSSRWHVCWEGLFRIRCRSLVGGTCVTSTLQCASMQGRSKPGRTMQNYQLFQWNASHCNSTAFDLFATSRLRYFEMFFPDEMATDVLSCSARFYPACSFCFSTRDYQGMMSTEGNPSQPTEQFTGENSAYEKKSNDFKTMCHLFQHVPWRPLVCHAKSALLPEMCETVTV